MVDFGAFVAGPYTSVILADLGADVVKVETLVGDPNRSIFRSFTSANRGKRSISLDLKSEEGNEIAKALAQSGAVATNNFRSGVSARLGIDPESLHALKPELVVLESPAYGSSGPLADRAGFDMVMQALCGHEYRAGGKGNEPLWNRTSMVDYTGGFLGAIATLAALYHRAHTDEGMTLNSALMSGGVYLLSELVQRPDGSFEGGEPFNTRRTGFHAAESLYQTSDDWIAIAVRGREAAAALSQVLGLDAELAADPLQWNDDAAEAISTAIAGWTTKEAIENLEGAGIWVEQCRRNVELEILNDPALEQAGVVQVSTHPQFGTVRELGAMTRFSRSVAGHKRHAPLRGDATRDLLAELGRSEAEIDALTESNVIA